jgi:hypothetical protein
MKLFQLIKGIPQNQCTLRYERKNEEFTFSEEEGQKRNRSILNLV